MKWKISTFLLLGLTIILCLTYLRQRQEISRLNAQSVVIGKTDTIYVNKPFKYEPSFSITQLPKYVFLYNSPYIDKDKLDIDNQSIQKEDSIVQVILNRENLSLSFKNILDSTYFKLDYKIDLDEFKYNWVNGNLTRQKVGLNLKLVPYVYTKYRPIHQMVDLGIGLSLKTQRSQYKFGINGYFYPSLEKSLGIDPEISITYNLSK